MPDRPHESVCIAVIDAIVSMGMADDGGVDQQELERTALRREEFAKAALTRYNQDHPAPDGDGETYNAIGDGLLLLASDATTWMVNYGHLVEIEPGRVRPGKALKVNGDSYSPGSAREEDLFHSIRRVTPKRLELIRQSMEDLGDLRDFFPVLRDVEGNVVDGRHRLAIDENWPAMRVRVPMDMRVAAAVAANRNNAWSAEDWRRLLHHRQQSVGRRQAVKIIVRLALLEDASRSSRQVAGLLGVDVSAVISERGELVGNRQVHHYEFTTAKTGKHSAACWCGEGNTEPKTQAKSTRKITAAQIEEIIAECLGYPEIMRRYDVGQGAAQNARTRADAIIGERESVARPAPPEPVSQPTESSDSPEPESITSTAGCRHPNKVCREWVCPDCGEVGHD